MAFEEKRTNEPSALECVSGDTTGGTSDTTTDTTDGDGTSVACSGVYSSGVQLVSGLVTDPIPSLPKPAKGEAYAEPTYKTCVVRVTDHAVEPPSGFARNDYSRRQAFNADSSRLLVYANDGFWHLYDAETFAHIKALSGPAGDAEPQWHPTDPDLL